MKRRENPSALPLSAGDQNVAVEPEAGDVEVAEVAKTVADLEDAENIEFHHIAEAINYSAFDHKLFG